jgi:trimeric autotransporter adhesin
MTKRVLIIFLLSLPTFVFSQVGIGTNSPAASAQLDVSSTTKGFLPPRMTSAQRSAIGSPTAGLMVYQTDATAGLYFYTGSAWIYIINATTNILPVANGGTGVTTSTGTGNVVLSTSPSLTTPSIGSGGFTLAGSTSGTTNVVTSAAASGTVTIPAGTATLASTSNKLSAFAATTSSELAGVISNETGSGSLVFSNSPSFTTPSLGAATATSLNNIFVGRRSSVNDGPMAVGYQALQNLTSGNMTTNTAIGYLSMYSTSDDGDFNTAVGNYSLYSNTNGSFNTAMGKNALIGNTTGNGNTAIGESALRWNTTGGNNVAIGSSAQASTFNTSGSQNILIGSGTQLQGNYNNTILIGYNLTAAASNRVIIGNSSSANYYTYGSWSVLSDAKAKHSISDLNHGRDLVSILRPVKYVYNNNSTGTHNYGFIAQEVKEALNEIGDNNSGMISKLDNEFLSMRTDDLIPILVKAIQEQQVEINELKNSIKKSNTRRKKLK